MKIVNLVRLIIFFQFILIISFFASVSSQKLKDSKNKKEKIDEKVSKKEMMEELKKAKKQINKQIKILENEKKNKTFTENKKEKNSDLSNKDDLIVETNEKQIIKKAPEFKYNNKIKEKEKEKIKIMIKKQKDNDISKEEGNYSIKRPEKTIKIISDKIKIFENQDEKTLYNKKKQDDQYLPLPDKQAYRIKNNLDSLDDVTISSQLRNKVLEPNNDFAHTFRIYENGVGLQHRKVIKTDIAEYNIPEINIDSSRKIDYYYPFFFKTKVVDYVEGIPSNTICTKCLDITCEYCNINQPGVCKKCRHGFFLHMGKCFRRCPINYIADIYRGACNLVDNSDSFSQVSYLKAFTFGSCKNICGRESIDCSCEKTCIYQGNCCSDFHECEDLYLNNLNKNFECQSGNLNCELCENFIHIKDPLIPGKLSPFKCGKCKEGFSLRYGECLLNCAFNDKIIMPNKICISTQKCLVENCAQCINNNPSVCKTCFGGMFLYNNQCLAGCPAHLRADRISMTCVEPQNYAWYWVFPSRATCLNKCGMEFNLLNGMDCSCNVNCLQKGNCCQDIDEYCSNIISIPPAIQLPSFMTLPTQQVMNSFPNTVIPDAVNQPIIGTAQNLANLSFGSDNFNANPIPISNRLSAPLGNPAVISDSIKAANSTTVSTNSTSLDD